MQTEKRWEDNFRKWTGLEFAKSQRAVENREKWRELVAKSSVVPRRPPQSEDRRKERREKDRKKKKKRERWGDRGVGE